MLSFKSLLQNPVIKKSLSLFSTDVLVRGANFLLIPVFLHLMTKNDFGVYGYLYNFAMTCSVILNLGYHSALPKLYIETSENRKDNASMLFTLSISLFGFLAFMFALFYITDADYAFFNIVNNSKDVQFDYRSYRPYLFVALASMIFSNFLTYYFISAKKIKNIQAFNLIRMFVCNIAVITVLYISKDTDKVLLRLSITYVTEFLLCCMFARSFIKEIWCKYRKDYMLRALKIGLPLSFVGLVNSVVNFGDKQFIMLYCGSEAMGAYNLATLLATIPLIVFQSFNFVWLPNFLGEKNLQTLKKKNDRNAKIILSVLLLLSILIWFGSYLLLQWNIFPRNYGEITSYLPMLLLSQVFAALILYYFNYFTYFEKTHIPMVISVCGAFAGYLLYSLSAEKFGAIGISTSIAVINIAITLFYIIFSNHYINKRIKATT